MNKIIETFTQPYPDFIDEKWILIYGNRIILIEFNGIMIKIMVKLIEKPPITTTLVGFYCGLIWIMR